MKAEERIRQAYAKLVGQAANAARIWKGYGPFGQRPYGWWIEPFNRPAWYVGHSVEAAIDRIEAMKEAWE